MPSKTFYADASKTQKILIKWGWNWKNISIQVNGEEIGRIATQKELKKGDTFLIAPGNKLFIRLSDSLTPELELFINGKPVAGSGADPAHTVKQLFYMGLVFGGIQIAIGIASELMHQEFLLMIGAGVGSVIIGLLMTGLAFGIKRGSIAAILATMALWGLDIAATVYYSMESARDLGVGGIVFKLFILYSLYRGIAAAKQLKAQPAPALAG